MEFRGDGHRINFKQEPLPSQKEFWVFLAISAIAYYVALQLTFVLFHFVDGLELRPATCIAVAAGMLWGFPDQVQKHAYNFEWLLQNAPISLKTNP